MSEPEFDLAIIGGGPGGYVAAIRGAQRGLKVALIEGRELGGVCLHAGCIPTKTMVASVDLLRQVRTATQHGLLSGSAEASLASLKERRQHVVQQLAQGIKFLFEKHGIRLIKGWGRLVSARTVSILDDSRHQETARVTAAAVILATGSVSADLAGLERDGRAVCHSGDVLQWDELPASIGIVGGGYIGCEFAQILAALGARVTVLELQPQLLPGMDRELGQALERSMKKEGITVMLNARIMAIEKAAQVQVHLEGGANLSVEKLLVSVGRVPNSAGLGLDSVGVQTERNGVIVVNESLATSVAGVYAIGDVTGKMALAHVASAQARYLIGHLVAPRQVPQTAPANPPPPFNYEAIPACVFTHPEIASVGLTEPQAIAQGRRPRVSRFPFAANGKALSAGETDGFVKLVADADSGRLLGAQIIGPHAAEIIGLASLAVRQGLTAAQLDEVIIAHPTLSEAFAEAAEGLFGQPIHIYTRPR